MTDGVQTSGLAKACLMWSWSCGCEQRESAKEGLAVDGFPFRVHINLAAPGPESCPPVIDFVSLCTPPGMTVSPPGSFGSGWPWPPAGEISSPSRSKVLERVLTLPSDVAMTEPYFRCRQHVQHHHVVSDRPPTRMKWSSSSWKRAWYLFVQ